MPCLQERTTNFSGKKRGTGDIKYKCIYIYTDIGANMSRKCINVCATYLIASAIFINYKIYKINS